MTITAERPAPALPVPPAQPRVRRKLAARTRDRIGLATLLVATAVFYLWNITINGMGNSFYAAAAQAGSKNWEALLFGSLDSHNFITVDKPPVSQWIMGLSGQIFGFSSASMLIPQALMGVAAVALLYGTVNRATKNPRAGLIAGSALALMPVAALMFRFNNPDAAMVLLMTAGAYCTVRALEKASMRWLAFAGVALGFAFLAKMLEGLMVLPALILAYLIVAPTTFWKRIGHLLTAAAAMALASGWYVVLTLLWPASSRPYLAGSTDNNFMNLVLGYNGLARILGRNHGGGAGHAPASTTAHAAPTAAELATTNVDAATTHKGGFNGFGGMGSHAGLTRLFNGEIGFELSWLLPTALIALIVVLATRGRRPRTDLIRGAAIVLGGWLIVDGLVLSYMNGTMHAYYVLAIAPAVAGLVGLGAHEVWRTRETWLGRLSAAALIGSAGIWGFILLNRNGSWLPWLRWTILIATIAAAVAFVIAAARPHLRRVAAVAALVGVLAGLGGSAAYAVATVATPHTGGSPTVGPAQSGRGGGFGAQQTTNPQLNALLESATTKWSAAINHSSAAAGLELSSNTAVMALGGFSNDPTPTLNQFIGYVQDHDVTYYIMQSGNGFGGNSPTSIPTAAHDTGSTRAASHANAQGQNANAQGQNGGWGNQGGASSVTTQIANWVESHFTAQQIGNATVYNLSTYTG